MRHLGGLALQVHALVMVVAIATLGGCGQQTQSAAELIELATQKLELRDFKAAQLATKEALKLDPDNGAGRLLAARLNVEVGQGKAALIELDKAEKLGVPSSDTLPTRLQALVQQNEYDAVLAIDVNEKFPASLQAEILAAQAVALVGKGEAETALARFDEALAKDPNNAAALTGKGFQLLKAGKFDDGRTLIVKATETQPGFAPAWSVLGDAEGYAGKYEAADAAYSKAIELRAVAPTDLVSRALVRLAQDNTEGAQADIELLKRQRFNLPHAAYVRGIMLLQDKKYGEALGEFTNVLAKYPNYIKAKCYAGLSALGVGSLQRADEELKSCLRSYPYADDMRRSYAAVQMALGDEQAGIDALRPLIDRDQPDADALSLMAEYERLRGNADAALKYAKTLVQSDTADTSRLIQLGLTLSAAGQEAEAASTFARAAEADPELKNADLIEAQALLATDNRKAAIEKLEGIVAQRPEDSQALNMLALAYARGGERGKSKELLEKAVAAAPGYSYAAINLAKMRREDGDRDGAAALLDGVLLREPGNVRALGMAVALDVERGQPDSARQRLDKAMQGQREPDEHLTLIAARFERSQGNAKRAVELYDTLVGRHGRRVEWLRELGQAQLEAGQSEQALKTLDAVITLSNRPAADWLQLARAQERAGDQAGAAKSIAEALASEPDNPAARLAEVRHLVRVGKTAEARARMDALKKMAPSQTVPELLTAEAYLTLREGKPSDAVDLFKSALAAAPSPDRAVDLARAQASIGDRVGALTTLEGWTAEHPDDLGVVFVLADAYAKSGDVPKARATYERLLQREPDNVLALNNLAWALRDADGAEALRLATRAAEVAPDAPAVLDTLGTLKLRAGETDAAVTALRKAVEQSNGNAAISLHLAQALVADDASGEAQRVLRDIKAESLDDGERQALARLKADLGMN